MAARPGALRADLAPEVSADAIVLPAHGLSSEEPFLGGTADRVLCSARRPVLIHREVHARRYRPLEMAVGAGEIP